MSALYSSSHCVHICTEESLCATARSAYCQQSVHTVSSAPGSISDLHAVVSKQHQSPAQQLHASYFLAKHNAHCVACSEIDISLSVPSHACLHAHRSEIEIVERIFDRVLGHSSDNQHLAGLAGCVAVANRNHLDHVSLVEADVEERCYFQAMLDDPAEAYAPMEVQQTLRDNMTIKKLIVKLDSLFHSFIVLRWKPAALTFLSPLQEQAQVSLISAFWLAGTLSPSPAI